MFNGQTPSDGSADRQTDRSDTSSVRRVTPHDHLDANPAPRTRFSANEGCYYAAILYYIYLFFQSTYMECFIQHYADTLGRT